MDGKDDTVLSYHVIVTQGAKDNKVLSGTELEPFDKLTNTFRAVAWMGASPNIVAWKWTLLASQVKLEKKGQFVIFVQSGSQAGGYTTH